MVELPGEFDEDYLKEGGDARTMGNSILLQSEEDISCWMKYSKNDSLGNGKT